MFEEDLYQKCSTKDDLNLVNNSALMFQIQGCKVNGKRDTFENY